MKNVKDKFDEGMMVVAFETEESRKNSAILLLALSSNTIHGPAYAHTKINIQQMKGAQMNERECCEREGGRRGYCESYLGVKYPSMRPLLSINLVAQMESWYLQRSKHQKKSDLEGEQWYYSATLGGVRQQELT